jgi:hypothetical protein
MKESDFPDPPESAPKYLAEGVPKQDTETLNEIKDWIQNVVEYRRSVDKEDLPRGAEVVKETPKGTITKEMVRCGDESCSCQEGEKHGPYRYRYFYQNGSLTSEYLGKA